MSDSLETRLAQAREQKCNEFIHANKHMTHPAFYFQAGFDAAATIAREVVADFERKMDEKDTYIVWMRQKINEKDAKIARLEARITAVKKEHRQAHGAKMCTECGHDFPCVTVTMLRNTLK